MQANKGKQDKNKTRCDRCQQQQTVIHECVFTFKHPFAYWKQQYEAREEKRLTRRRQRTMGDEANFDYRNPPAYYVDLCDSCWSHCSQPWDGFPMDFYRQVILQDQNL